MCYFAGECARPFLFPLGLSLSLCGACLGTGTDKSNGIHVTLVQMWSFSCTAENKNKSKFIHAAANDNRQRHTSDTICAVSMLSELVFYSNTYRFVHVARKVYMTQTERWHEQGPRNADEITDHFIVCVYFGRDSNKTTYQNKIESKCRGSERQKHGHDHSH